MQHILIVEDDLIQCNMLKDTIHQEYPTWDIDTAVCYDDAIELLETSIENNKKYW